MMSRKNTHSNQPQKQAQNCRLLAANRLAYAPLTARLRMPFTLSQQEARCAVFCQALDLTILGPKNARFGLQNARKQALDQE